MYWYISAHSMRKSVNVITYGCQAPRKVKVEIQNIDKESSIDLLPPTLLQKQTWYVPIQLLENNWFPIRVFLFFSDWLLIDLYILSN